jgi:MscS family membrane protein
MQPRSEAARGRARAVLTVAIRCAGSLALLVLPLAAFSAETPFPLEPPDRSSPRATLATFNRSFDEAWEGYSKRQLGWRAAFVTAALCLDNSSLPPAVREGMTGEATLLLREILDRVPPFPPEDVPDAAAVEASGLKQWTIPHTEIVLARTPSGDRAGEFLFSAATVARIPEDYEKVKRLPYRAGRSGAHYDELRFGGLSPALTRLAALLPAPLRREVGGALVWQWAAVLACLVLATLLAAWAFRTGRRLTRWEKEKKGGPRLGPFLFPLLLFGLAHADRFVAFYFLRLAGTPYFALRLVLTTIAHLAVAWLIAVALTRLGELVALLFRTPDQPLNAQLVAVSFRILTILAVTGYLFLAAQWLGLPVPALVAGLGVGGLAVALATQSTLENLIGGLILYADRPVRVGDVFRLGDRVGVVEAIGLRSARVRTTDRSVIAIPNSDLIRREIENLTLRDRIPLRPTVRLRLETSPDQLRYLLARLTRLLDEHPRLVKGEGKALLAGVGEYALEVELRTYAATTEFDEFRMIRQDVLLQVIGLVEEAGTRLAVPVAVELQGADRALDAERTRAAEQRARKWRQEGTLPFPEFGSEG